MSAERSVAVVGAGMSGAMCARLLADEGFRITVIDKGRGPGGRAATRQAQNISVDHGAQYFTIRDSRFRTVVARWLDRGVVQEWSGTFVTLRQGEAKPAADEPRYVGVPGMSAVVRNLLDGVSCVFETTVEGASCRGRKWELSVASGPALGPFDVVLLSAPPAQSARIAGPAHPWVEETRAITMEPCWAAVLGFTSPIDLPFDAAFVENSPLSWIARDSGKPGRSQPLDVWVLHASAAWSRVHLEQSPEFVALALQDAFEAATLRSSRPARPLVLHRWRYARPEKATDVGSLYDPSLGIGMCGDWLTDGRIESAALSGMHLAERVKGGAAS